MKSHGFKINECDKCVYVKDTTLGYVIVCLYVDDMFIVGNDDKMISFTKNMLNSSFDIVYKRNKRHIHYTKNLPIDP